MYIPSAFQMTDLSTLHQFMDEHSFAVLTTTGPRGLAASHLPLLLDATEGQFGTLFGHFAKGNDQWSNSFGEALAIFSGPHAYISPTWYQTPNTVPTWNYVAVHAYGVMQLIEDDAKLTKLLQASVEKYEGSRPSPWPFDPDTEFHQKLMGGIVGFRIEITRLEGKWKLNQNHPVERRQRVIAELNAMGGEQSSAIARLMEATL